MKTRRGTRTGYFQRIHVALVVALVVISVVVGIVGWLLHPASNGFQTVPSVTILVSGSQFLTTETLTQTGGNGATLKVAQLGGSRYVPLRNSDPVTLLSGPTAAGAVATSLGPSVQLDGKAIPNESWTFIILDPGSAQACDPHQRYRAGTVKLPLHPAHRALVIPPLPPPPPNIGNYVAPPGLCLRWESGAPINLSGPYLSARFPPLRGVTGTFDQLPEDGDVGSESVTRVLNLADGSTANFNVQSDPHPAGVTSTYWTWVTPASPQVIQLAAINTSDAQRENNNAFYSGILFGVVGGALIGLITELVVPLGRGRQDDAGT